MKKIIFLSIILIATALLAEIKTEQVSQITSIEKQQLSKDDKVLEIKRRGCCSWHGGVSGCSNGRIVCNDGSYSPSCTCVVPQSPLG